MPSAAYYEWLAAGEPYEPCRPVREFVDLLRGKGYTVYHKGDTSHMQAERPEDHTPFSETGWPVPSKRWIGHALDIMPGGGPLDLATLAVRIIRARNSNVYGVRWIKYINWTDESGLTWHYSWEPSYDSRASTDKGHIHISARSDMDTSDEVSRSGYTPFGGSIVASTLTPKEQYLLHIFNHRIEGILAGRPIVDVPAFTASDGSKFPALSTANNPANTLRELLENTKPGNLVSALTTMLAERPEIVDALATAVAARLGMIPTAGEIAKKVGELVWHGTPAV